MLPVKLIIEVENELTKLGYRFGLNKLIAGWVHDEEPFIRFQDQVHFLKDHGLLKTWKVKNLDDWTEVKKRVKQQSN